MRKTWIAVVVVAIILVGTYAVMSSPIFDKAVDEPDKAADLDYSLTFDDGQFTFVMKNTGDSSSNLEFATGEHVRILAKKGSEVIYNSSEGMMFTQAFNTVSLASGEQKTYQFRWEGAPEGEYTVEAYVLAVSVSRPVTTIQLTID